MPRRPRYLSRLRSGGLVSRVWGRLVAALVASQARRSIVAQNGFGIDYSDIEAVLLNSGRKFPTCKQTISVLADGINDGRFS